jgi:predicted  nucleic acid-binding Zn-ribbon protein
MPHTCTRCNSVFGSGEDILKGCPVCGWKKFMFVRARPGEVKGEKEQQDQIITEAMGVRVPPRRAPKEDLGILLEPSKTHLPSSSLIQESVPLEAPQIEKSGAEGTTLESIKITAPGTYELNLPSLFEREELIMAVKEGTYFIDLSSAFRKGKKD